MAAIPNKIYQAKAKNTESMANPPALIPKGNLGESSTEPKSAFKRSTDLSSLVMCFLVVGSNEIVTLHFIARTGQPNESDTVVVFAAESIDGNGNLRTLLLERLVPQVECAGYK